MTPRVFDASWQRPKPALLQPGDGIILYASRTDSKCPTAAECDAYRARGVTVRFVFEDAADRAAQTGYAAGQWDGALTLDQVKAKGGQQGDAVYFACDTYLTISLDYARGFRDGLTTQYTPRLYAGDRNLEHVRVNLGMTKGWQAGAANWSDHWNGNHGAYPDASLYQVAGASPIPGTDINIINQPDWSGDDVALSLDDLNAIRQQVIIALNDPTHSYLQDEFAKSNAAVIAGVTAQLTNLQTELDAVKAVVTGLSTGGAVAFDVTGTLTPKTP